MLATLVLLTAVRPTVLQETTYAFTNARILPVSAPPIERGVLIVRGTTIVAAGQVPIPAGAVVVDMSGKTIMPGLVDTHSHIGGASGGDSSGPIQPEARVYDSINPRDAGFKRALAGGITTLNVMPGSGHLMSGQTLYVKNRLGKTVDEISIREDDGWVMGGLKMANGTNPIGSPPAPGTRAKSMALIRDLYLRAQDYKRKRDEFRDKLAKGETTPDKAPARDLAMEPLVEALEGRRIVQHHTHRQDDILSVIRLQREFGLRVVLHHVSEAWKVAAEIAAAGLPCSITLVDSPGGKQEALETTFAIGRELERAGVVLAYNTDDAITESRLLLRVAALGIRAGLSREAALRAVTLAPAAMLGLDKRIGSLEAGKDADFVVLSGDPFSVYTKILETWVEGKKVFDRSLPKDRLIAVGGYGAGDPLPPYLCCEGGN